MLTTLLLAAAFSGNVPKGQHPSPFDDLPKGTVIYSQKEHRDPFVSPKTWNRLMIERTRRLAYLEEACRTAGLAREEFASFLDLDPSIYPRVYRPKRAINWTRFRNEVLADGSLADGIDFHREHRTALERADKRYGVPALAIVALIRVESNFGMFAFDPENARNVVAYVFYTETMTSHSKWQEAARTLARFLVYCRNNKFDPAAIRGSWAGAFGLIQFMPFNLEPYGVDGNGDGIVDLFDPDDAIPTAANFLRDNGAVKDLVKALTRYFGVRCPYQEIALAYENALRGQLKHKKNTPPRPSTH
ncbi:MAG TPA: lytic murein transglycosylase [Candidatus Paceibacterota bacterium]|nr:lytic murein transglycosylase [Candidatus Paceibacterota bacterium]